MIVRIGDSGQVSNFNQLEICFMGNGYTFRPGTSKEYPKRSVSATITEPVLAVRVYATLQTKFLSYEYIH